MLSPYKDLNRLEKWSASSGLVFNQDKCKCHRVTRKKNPIKHEYKINSKSLVVTEKEKDLGIWITDTLHWSYHTHDRCTKANKMLGFLRRAAMEITDVKIRRTLYLSIVRSTLGYATQVWSPQSIDRVLNHEDRANPTTSYKVHFEVTVRVCRNVQRQIDHLKVTPYHLLARIP